MESNQINLMNNWWIYESIMNEWSWLMDGMEPFFFLLHCLLHWRVSLFKLRSKGLYVLAPMKRCGLSFHPSLASLYLLIKFLFLLYWLIERLARLLIALQHKERMKASSMNWKDWLNLWKELVRGRGAAGP